MTEEAHGDPDDADVEDLFRRITAGELDLDSAEVRERTAHAPRAMAELRAMLQLDDELHAVRSGTDRLPTDTAEPWAGADAAVAAMVRRHFTNHGQRRRRWIPLLAGAAVLAAGLAMAVAFGWFDGRRERPNVVDPDIRLGDARFWPSSAVSRDELTVRGLDWSALPDLPSTATFQVELRAASGQTWRSPVLHERRWSIPPDALTVLVGAFEWRLEATSPGRAPQRWTNRASVN